ncbi:anaerobic ribonucleoside-triphosphate reductase-activating protein [Shewanella psychrotolerans]|uniref:anaerobic ribonucleoside-triphosphate reductase-activating protein n=1 Tax=Shewanella psychrotolerans TaxID=2864206 RepID=UPI001C65713A|nr:anaerobic ribonucleoside-triphosphate reductase-activating protein [Shewanella psychrotolerans]QYK02676.1 anaerobic ribonucleoside-triphosphate reductase-activating protein [Shewanella psychrotolerans]
MNYHQYFPIDVVNGPGTRASLFVSGCEHQCRGCYNQSTWNPCSGHLFDDVMVEQILTDLKDSRIHRRGLSLSGGDPLYPQNVEAILALVKRVKAECPTKDIWLWTGYTLDELNDAQREVLNYIDVLVDGKFEQSLADPSLIFRGSSNQVIHHFSQ